MTNSDNMITPFIKKEMKALLFLTLLIASLFFQSFNNIPTKPDTLQVFETPEQQREGRQMLSDFVKNQLAIVASNRQEELNLLKTSAEWEARQEKTRGQLDKYFGKFPEKTPLNARVVGKIEHEQYTIEKVIFESRPNYYVSANLYIPKNRTFPVPGAVFLCGHSRNGKAMTLYHETGLGLVLKGYAVISIDPMGQGERNEYPNVIAGVRQHHYIGRPSFLLNQTLSGLRVWDAIRAVDYFTSRPEVDNEKLGAVGNSGGGQMALLLTAVDERIQVCVAAHPGGSMESTYLTGQGFPNTDIFSLIAPRPLRIIVGDESGENHSSKLNDLYPFYEGLGYKKDRAELVMVNGKHDIKKPKRVAAYEWFNKWFDKEIEGKTEPFLMAEKEKDLWCTLSGSTIAAGSLSTQMLNQNLLEKVYKTTPNERRLKDRIAERIKLESSKDRKIPKSMTKGKDSYGDLSIEKLTYESETGISIPSLLIKPNHIKRGSPVYLYVSDRGKPEGFVDTLMLFKLAKNGFIVLSIDVRGTGETSPTGSFPKGGKYTSYTSEQWKHDGLAIRSATFGRTMVGMRVFDIIRAIDYIETRNDLRGKKVVVMGDGLGGLWASLSSVFDKRVKGVVTIGTLPSYKPLITNQYYNVNPGYFWLPGALLDFDVPDLMRLISPKPNIWIDPIGSLGEKLNSNEVNVLLKPYPNFQVINDGRSDKDVLALLEGVFK